MTMEILANELILDTFEYLSATDLFHAFHGLNERFDGLLREYLRVHPYVDFRLGYKDEIQLMRRQYLPLVADDLRGMYLSDQDSNPHLIDLFLSRLFPLYRFENLTTISLEHLSSLEKLVRFLDDVQRLPHLTALHLHRSSLEADQKSIVRIVNAIWSLPQLTTCTLDLSFRNHNHFIPPTLISCSLRHLILRGVLCLQANLAMLHEHTPFLDSLCVQIWNVEDDDDENDRSPSMWNLTSLEVQCHDQSVVVRTLLRPLWNLTRLNIRMKDLSLDGEQWQTLIRQRLPQLVTFQLQMELTFNDLSGRDEEVERILQTFRSAFWIEEHQWFIQCHGNATDESSSVYFYTLPFAFEHFSLEIEENFFVRSTGPTTTAEDFDQVKTLRLAWNIYEDVSLSNIVFDQLRDLSVALPLNEQFLSLLPRLDRLVSLEVRIDQFLENEDEFVQLQQILDRATRLFTLKFHSWPKLYKNEHQNRRVSRVSSSSRARSP